MISLDISMDFDLNAKQCHVISVVPCASNKRNVEKSCSRYLPPVLCVWLAVSQHILLYVGASACVVDNCSKIQEQRGHHVYHCA